MCSNAANYDICPMTCSGCKSWFVRCDRISADLSIVDTYSATLCSHLEANGACMNDTATQQKCRLTCSGCTRAPTTSPTMSPTASPSLSTQLVTRNPRYSLEITFDTDQVSHVTNDETVKTQVISQVVMTSGGFVQPNDIDSLILSSNPIEATIIFKSTVGLSRINYLRTIVLATPIVVTDGMHSYTSTGVSTPAAVTTAPSGTCIGQVLRVVLRVDTAAAEAGTTGPTDEEIGRAAAVSLYTSLLQTAPLQRLPCVTSIEEDDAVYLGLFFDFPQGATAGCYALFSIFGNSASLAWTINANGIARAVSESQVLTCDASTTPVTGVEDTNLEQAGSEDSDSTLLVVGATVAALACTGLLAVLAVVRCRRRSEPTVKRAKFVKMVSEGMGGESRAWRKPTVMPSGGFVSPDNENTMSAASYANIWDDTALSLPPAGYDNGLGIQPTDYDNQHDLEEEEAYADPAMPSAMDMMMEQARRAPSMFEPQSSVADSLESTVFPADDEIDDAYSQASEMASRLPTERDHYPQASYGSNPLGSSSPRHGAAAGQMGRARGADYSRTAAGGHRAGGINPMSPRQRAREARARTNPRSVISPRLNNRIPNNRTTDSAPSEHSDISDAERAAYNRWITAGRPAPAR